MSRTRKGRPIRDTTKVYTAALLGLKRNPKPNPKADEKWVETESGVLSHWKGKSLHTITEADVRNLLKRDVRPWRTDSCQPHARHAKMFLSLG